MIPTWIILSRIRQLIMLATENKNKGADFIKLARNQIQQAVGLAMLLGDYEANSGKLSTYEAQALGLCQDALDHLNREVA